MSRDPDRAMRVLGIMSGTSIDSVDFALCRISEGTIKLLDYWQRPFPPKLAARLRSAAADQSSCYEAGQLHHDLGRFYAKAAGSVKPDLIGLHGQTVYHQPNGQSPATFQIGEPAYLAQHCRADVISNFRAADLAAGGQGAPLATMFHKHLFASKGRHVAVQNLGGISNVTSLDWSGKKLSIQSFDTGPANMLIDMAAQELSRGRLKFDNNGHLAARGNILEEILKQALRHPFFRRKPPKSTGRELFGEDYLKKIFRDMKQWAKEDILATITELTARSIGLNYKLHLKSAPDEMIVCGGGAKNAHLMRRLELALPRIRIMAVESKGWPSQSIEPAAFALLAWLRARGKPGNIPETTGASRALLCGQITAP
jgi:anhydro-N-acetylmuramic acid kinase